MTTQTTQAPHALIDVSNWIVHYLEAKHPEMRGAIHADMSFDNIGLDSLARVEMIAAMENRFGVALDPTLAYDFVTAGALSSFVWGQITGVAVDQKQLMGV